jgi:predicted ATPase with chaperone activity
MLFKTSSASVYGIDAYPVEVEVDVGSARMQDFNVVGLPDNAVKESRECIKSAMRNCGYEFPHGQGVTINLAPADLRKEGSAFDLPMALGWVGCQGQFFGKLLDRMMFLREVPAVKDKELRAPSSSEDSAAVRGRVIAAQQKQITRYKSEKKTYSNAQMASKMVRKHCAISVDGEKLLENAVTRLGLSARAHDRILKVARTIADLDAAPDILPKHLSEAVNTERSTVVIGRRADLLTGHRGKIGSEPLH